MNSSGITLLGLCLAAAAGSAGLNTLADAARSDTAPRRGGLRAVAADMNWLRAYEAWRAKDEERTLVLIRRSIAWDPRADFFRINAARIIAHDFPAWRTESEPGAPSALREKWRREGARAAVDLLEQGNRAVGDRAFLHSEIAGYHWHALGDLEKAAGHYRQAALLPGAPWHAGRLHAEALLRLGRREEARDWLRRWLRALPANEPAAQRAIVAERLARLERELDGQ
jgi:tetratricopeptide (TPR) repeat protein